MIDLLIYFAIGIVVAVVYVRWCHPNAIYTDDDGLEAIVMVTLLLWPVPLTIITLWQLTRLLVWAARLGNHE